MAVIISNKNNQKTFHEKDFIIIGSNSDCDYKLDLDFDLLITVQYDENSGKCTVINNFSNERILFCGKPLIEKLVIEKFCKLKIEGTDDFIGIKPAVEISHNFTSELSDKLEKRKAILEKSRVAITKEIAFTVADLKKKISLNFNSAIILNIALLIISVIVSFGVCNYFTGLPISDTVAFLTMPFNIKLLAIFSILTYAVGLSFKAGVCLLLQNKDDKKPSSVTAQNVLIIMSSLMICAFYGINLIYYMNPGGRIIYAMLISLFFISLMLLIAASCGYFKYNGHRLARELDRYEYREDLELVLNEYQSWIEMYINNIGNVKLNYIKEKMFNLHIKGFFEISAGILTAPFLAYGVSNTLAMCFPEAAGWVRISGLRFSPVFLILATMLIIFAFFTLSNAFTNIRKIAGFDVIKLDGFRNYLLSGVDIFGIENVRALQAEKNRLFVIGISIIFIEFTMNTSYFMTEIGADLNGILLSIVAALVPTALLVAETYMLSKTNYEIFASDSLIAKLDKK